MKMIGNGFSQQDETYFQYKLNKIKSNDTPTIYSLLLLYIIPTF